MVGVCLTGEGLDKVVEEGHLGGGEGAVVDHVHLPQSVVWHAKMRANIDVAAHLGWAVVLKSCQVFEVFGVEVLVDDADGLWFRCVELR